MRRVRCQSGGVALTTAMPPAGVVGVAPVTPLLAAPGVRHEQVSQLVLGETAALLGSEGDWRRIRCTMDGYEGWAHRGYLKELETAALERWNPGGWSQGAELDAEGSRVRLPLRALVGLEGGSIVLPDGRRARVSSGRVASRSAATADARAVRPDLWAAEHFLGAPYQWGGVTPWGTDCSGLVQTTFAARAVRVPRDAHEQAGYGHAIPLDRVAPGDLLFFSTTSPGASHVGIAIGRDEFVHAPSSTGVVRSPSFAVTRSVRTSVRENTTGPVDVASVRALRGPGTRSAQRVTVRYDEKPSFGANATTSSRSAIDASRGTAASSVARASRTVTIERTRTGKSSGPRIACTTTSTPIVSVRLSMRTEPSSGMCLRSQSWSRRCQAPAETR